MSRQVCWHCSQVHHLAQRIGKYHNLGIALLGRLQLSDEAYTDAFRTFYLESAVAGESQQVSDSGWSCACDIHHKNKINLNQKPTCT